MIWVFRGLLSWFPATKIQKISIRTTKKVTFFCWNSTKYDGKNALIAWVLESCQHRGRCRHVDHCGTLPTSGTSAGRCRHGDFRGMLPTWRPLRDAADIVDAASAVFRKANPLKKPIAATWEHLLTWGLTMDNAIAILDCLASHCVGRFDALCEISLCHFSSENLTKIFTFFKPIYPERRKTLRHTVNGIEKADEKCYIS